VVQFGQMKTDRQFINHCEWVTVMKKMLSQDVSPTSRWRFDGLKTRPSPWISVSNLSFCQAFNLTHTHACNKTVLQP